MVIYFELFIYLLSGIKGSEEPPTKIWTPLPMPEHDYTVDKDELLSAAQVLENALSHIHELQSKISGLKQISRFGVERFGTNDDLTRFYTGFQTSQLLYEFI